MGRKKRPNVVILKCFRGGREVRQAGGEYLFSFKGEGHKMSPRFHLFVYDVNQGIDGPRCVQDFLA